MSRPEQAGRSTTVLVVDDEAPLRLLCRVNLEGAGMTVIEATDGLSAIDQARARRPDVVLLDVMMPGLDGWQVATRLADDELTRAIPIVFLTARAELRDRARGLDAGGFGYVTKPFNPVELAEIVRDVVACAGSAAVAPVRRRQIDELRDPL